MGERPGEHAEEMSELTAARWAAINQGLSSINEARLDGTLDSDSLTAVFEQVFNIDVDMVEVRDAIHVPDDAGQHADALEAVLRRIPDGWGRWISCNAGWYPLVVETDQRCAAVCADYIVHQVKEKFGVLRYYCETPRVPELACCTEFKQGHPVPDLGELDEGWPEWAHLYAAHEATDVPTHVAHGEQVAVWREQRSAVSEVTTDALNRSAAMCENDGSPGRLMRRYGRAQTLCASCAVDGWEPMSLG